MWLNLGRVSARVKVGDEGRSHCDRSRVAEGKVVQTEHQTLPGGAKRFTNILKDKHTDGLIINSVKFNTNATKMHQYQSLAF